MSSQSKDFEEQASEDLAKVSREIKWLEELTETEGWKIFETNLTAATRMRRIQAFDADLKDLDSAFLIAGLKGTVAGLQLAQQLVSILIEDLTANKQTYQELLDERDTEPTGRDNI